MIRVEQEPAPEGVHGEGIPAQRQALSPYPRPEAPCKKCGVECGSRFCEDCRKVQRKRAAIVLSVAVVLGLMVAACLLRWLSVSNVVSFVACGLAGGLIAYALRDLGARKPSPAMPEVAKATCKMCGTHEAEGICGPCGAFLTKVAGVNLVAIFGFILGMGMFASPIKEHVGTFFGLLGLPVGVGIASCIAILVRSFKNQMGRGR